MFQLFLVSFEMHRPPSLDSKLFVSVPMLVLAIVIEGAGRRAGLSIGYTQSVRSNVRY